MPHRKTRVRILHFSWEISVKYHLYVDLAVKACRGRKILQNNCLTSVFFFRFEYQPKKDTAEGIAQELLGTGLICQDDVQPMATNLNQLISNPPPTRVLTFRVLTGFGANDIPDEKTLLGFAQLSLSD